MAVPVKINGLNKEYFLFGISAGFSSICNVMYPRFTTSLSETLNDAFTSQYLLDNMDRSHYQFYERNFDMEGLNFFDNALFQNGVGIIRKKDLPELYNQLKLVTNSQDVIIPLENKGYEKNYPGYDIVLSDSNMTSKILRVNALKARRLVVMPVFDVDYNSTRNILEHELDQYFQRFNMRYDCYLYLTHNNVKYLRDSILEMLDLKN